MKGKWSPAHLAPEGVVERNANRIRKMKRKNQTEMDL